MLQTIKGISKLEKSIPKIKQEFKEPISDKDNKIRKKGFSLNGKKIMINL